MKWMRSVWRWGSLGISVTALSAIALAGKHWAEQHALAGLLGEGARTDSLTMHWRHSAGCAENVSIPLASAKPESGTRLTARRMWFTYDLPALLRKRVVLPRIVIEDAYIIAASGTQAMQPPALAPQAPADSQAQQWAQQLRAQAAALEAEQFISGTQVAIDTAMLSEQWQANFLDVHNRAQRMLAQAKDIQQELAALDNPLRHEANVIARRERLEELKGELAGLKNSLLKTDKTLREQQSRIREALLAEKQALRKAGSTYQSPPASELAEITLDGWLAACLNEPTQYSVVLTGLVCSPFRQSAGFRGDNIRHADAMTAQFAASSAKIAGDISLAASGSMPARRAPFTASGSFIVSPYGPARANGANAEKARWQMSVGRGLNCISLEAKARDARAGIAEVKVESTAPGEVEAQCQVTGSAVAGTGGLRLRDWLGERSQVSALNQAATADPLLRKLLDEALKSHEHVPEEIEFGFTNQAGSTRVELDERDADWLAEGLAQAASAHVARKYDAAVEKLETHILGELEALNRSVAVSYNEASQHLQQCLQEMKVLQAEVMNNLAQRAGTEFARKSAGDTLR